MENLAVITALYHSGSFRNHLLGFRKKKSVIHQRRSVRIGKNRAVRVSKTLGTVFPSADFPSGE